MSPRPDASLRLEHIIQMGGDTHACLTKPRRQIVQVLELIVIAHSMGLDRGNPAPDQGTASRCIRP
jgi:hypothetical protein